MLALRTTDSWSSISISFNDGTGAQAYTPTAGVADAYALAEDMVAWLASAFGALWVWSWARDATTASGDITYTALNGTWDITPNATAQSLMGVAAAYVGVTVMNGLHAGTQAPSLIWSVRNWTQDASGGGMASGTGAIRKVVPGLAPRRPDLECAGDSIDAARLTSILASSANPRTAQVYEAHADTWRLVSLGPVTSRKSGKLTWRISIDAQGAP